MKKLVSLLLCLICGFFCVAQQVYNVDLSKAVYKQIPMTDILDNIKVVFLKVPDSLSIGDGLVEFTEDGKHLIVSNPSEGPYMFDINGNFIRIIEPSPSDYKELGTKYLNCHFDRKKNIFYEDFFDRWLGIDIQTNKIVKCILKPLIFKNRLTSFMQLNEDEYIGYSNDSIGGGLSHLIFFDSSGRILKHEPDLQPYANNSLYPQGPFKENNSQYYFVDPYLGTKIYKIVERKLVPYIYFQAGDNKLTNVVETEGRIYFSFVASDDALWGYYCKNENQVYIASNSKTVIKSSNLDKMDFFPSFVQGRNSVTSRMERDKLKVIMGVFK